MSKRILGIGNAIVDVFSYVQDDFLKKNNLVKGSMKLLDKYEFQRLKKKIKIEKTLAGGSVANTMVGITYLGGFASFIGKINNDEFGTLYKKSLKNSNVNFIYKVKNEKLHTGACIVLITPDSERTMCTYLGISSRLSFKDLNKNKFKNLKLIFLEGYLWDKGLSERMFKEAIRFSKKNKIKIAMTLSDIFCVKRHKLDFINLLKNDLDILIGNENEINKLMNKNNLLESIKKLKNFNKLIVITRSEKGSIAIQKGRVFSCKSYKVNQAVDLTGAGDLFASGFLKEYVNGSKINKCLKLGSYASAQVIQKVGARLEKV
jgi:sugar/nucleoside kinase (ribokinase family)